MKGWKTLFILLTVAAKAAFTHEYPICRRLKHRTLQMGKFTTSSKTEFN
jgi:hypothetical protein